MRVRRVASPGDPRDGTDLMRIHVHREGLACLASANCNSPIRIEIEGVVFLNASNDVASLVACVAFAASARRGALESSPRQCCCTKFDDRGGRAVNAALGVNPGDVRRETTVRTDCGRLVPSSWLQAAFSLGHLLSLPC